MCLVIVFGHKRPYFCANIYSCLTFKLHILLGGPTEAVLKFCYASAGLLFESDCRLKLILHGSKIFGSLSDISVLFKFLMKQLVTNFLSGVPFKKKKCLFTDRSDLSSWALIKLSFFCVFRERSVFSPYFMAGGEFSAWLQLQLQKLCFL